MEGKQGVLEGRQSRTAGRDNMGGLPDGTLKKVRAVSAYNAYWQARAGMAQASSKVPVSEDDGTVWPEIHPD
jgi:hypothetical protein